MRTHSLRVVLLTCALSAACACVERLAGRESGPVLRAIEPSASASDQSVPTVIHGENLRPVVTASFRAGQPAKVNAVFQARLGQFELLQVTWVDGATLTATVPAALPLGQYGLTVIDPAGRSASLAKAFVVGCVSPSLWYHDADGDSYGEPGESRLACEPPEGYVADDADCDDSRGTCTTDCTADVDKDGIIDCADSCLDSDGDGYGDPGGAGNACLGADCADNDAQCANNCLNGCASCADTCCGEKCGASTCLDLACTSGCTCDYDCAGSNLCKVSCEAGTQCRVNCAGASTCQVTASDALVDFTCTDVTETCKIDCDDHARCAVTCAGANDCNLKCNNTASCEFDCRSVTGQCTAHCKAGAACLLTCADSPSCSYATCTGGSGIVSCPGGVFACNRACP